MNRITGLRTLLTMLLVAGGTSVAHGQFPQLLKDIYPGSQDSSNSGFADWSGLAVFKARTPGEGEELWASDGTPAGTHLLKDIWPGSSTSNPLIGTGAELNGWHYFSANDGSTGSELWRSDGTSANTTLFFEFAPGPDSSSPQVRRLGNVLVIAATTVSLGRELWVSDGTVLGTQPLADILPGPGSSLPFSVHFDDFQGKLWFRATDGVHGNEPWITDGTAAGTQMLADVWPGAGSGDGHSVLEMPGGIGLFRGNDGVVGAELWRTDGTAAGTWLVKDIWPGASSSSLGLITVLPGQGAFMLAKSPAHGYEPWITDGTANGTFELADLSPGTSDLNNLNGLAVLPTAVVGLSITPATGAEAWASDGTQAGTRFLEIIPGPASGATWTSLTASGDRAYFYGWEIGSDLGLATCNGTLAGTYWVKKPVGFAPGSVSQIRPVEGGVFFSLHTLGRDAVCYGNESSEFTQVLLESPGVPMAAGLLHARKIGGHLFLQLRTSAFGGEPYAMEIDGDGDGIIEFFDALNLERDCFCDVGLAPCGNADPAAGCVNSTGVGARLDGSGSTQLSKDDLVLTVNQLPPNVNGLMFMGGSAGQPLPFFDGVRCVGAPIARWPGTNAGPLGTMTYGPGLAAQAAGYFQPTFHLLAGTTWRFQAWYRNQAGPCSMGSNLSNSATVVFTP